MRHIVGTRKGSKHSAFNPSSLPRPFTPLSLALATDWQALATNDTSAAARALAQAAATANATGGYEWGLGWALRLESYDGCALVFIVGGLALMRELWPFLVAQIVSTAHSVTNAFRPSGHHQCNKPNARSSATIQTHSLRERRMPRHPHTFPASVADTPPSLACARCAVPH